MTLIKSKSNGTPKSLMNGFFSDAFLDWPSDRFEKKWNNSPAVNIFQNENQWTVDLAVPGMKKEDFTVELENDLLSISAEAKSEEQDNSEKYTWKEFSYSGFKRSFRLPEGTVDADGIDARYENGVLSINIPKKEEAKPQLKKIEIA